MKTTNILFKQHLLETKIKYDLLFQNLNKVLTLLTERGENLLHMLEFYSKIIEPSQNEHLETILGSVQKFKELERLHQIVEENLIKEYEDFKIAEPRQRMLILKFNSKLSKLVQSMKEKVEYSELAATQKEAVSLFSEVEHKVKVLVNQPVISLDSIFQFVADSTRAAFVMGVRSLKEASTKIYEIRIKSLEVKSRKDSRLTPFQTFCSTSNLRDTPDLSREVTSSTMPLIIARSPSPVSISNQKNQKASANNLQQSTFMKTDQSHEQSNSKLKISNKIAFKIPNQGIRSASMDKIISLSKNDEATDLMDIGSLERKNSERFQLIANRVEEILSVEETTTQREIEEKQAELIDQHQDKPKAIRKMKPYSIEIKKNTSGKPIPFFQPLECSGIQMSLACSPLKFWRKKDTIVLEPLPPKVENDERHHLSRRSSIQHETINLNSERPVKAELKRKERSLDPLPSITKPVKQSEKSHIRLIGTPSPHLTFPDRASLYDILDLEHKTFPTTYHMNLKKIMKEKIISELTVMNVDVKKIRLNYLARLQKFCTVNLSRSLHSETSIPNPNVASKDSINWEARRQFENLLNNTVSKFENVAGGIYFNAQKTNRSLRNNFNQLNVSPNMFETTMDKDLASATNFSQQSQLSSGKNKYFFSAQNPTHLISDENEVAEQNLGSSLANDFLASRLDDHINTSKLVILPRLELIEEIKQKGGVFGQEFSGNDLPKAKDKTLYTSRNHSSTSKNRILEPLQPKIILREA